MWREPVAVRFGGTVTEAELTQFHSVAEAIEELGNAEVLALLNYAHRTRQLMRIRQTLEHHKRESGKANQ